MAGAGEITFEGTLQRDSAMIFVTVGTTHFDTLIKAVDELAESGEIAGRVVCQIGAGKYIPQHTEHFAFQPSIDAWIDDADLVVCHGGATVMSLLQRSKRFVAIANTALAGDHQTTFLSRLAQSVAFPWARDVETLGTLINDALNNAPPVITLPHLADELRRCVYRCSLIFSGSLLS